MGKVRAVLTFSFAICLGLTTVCLASEEVSSLVKQVMPGVVLIQTYDSNGNELGQGSGFIISKDNYFRQIKATKRIRLWEIATQLHRIGCTFALDILKLNFREYIR